MKNERAEDGDEGYDAADYIICDCAGVGGGGVGERDDCGGGGGERLRRMQRSMEDEVGRE